MPDTLLAGCQECQPWFNRTPVPRQNPGHYAVRFGIADAMQIIRKSGETLNDVVEVQTGTKGWAVRIAMEDHPPPGPGQGHTAGWQRPVLCPCGSGETKLWLDEDPHFTVAVS